MYPGQQVGVPDGADVFDWGHIGLSVNGGHPIGTGWRPKHSPTSFQAMYVRRPYAFGIFKEGYFIMFYFGRKAMDFKWPFWRLGKYSNGSRFHSDAFVWTDDE
jgi:hypothetical protein